MDLQIHSFTARSTYSGGNALVFLTTSMFVNSFANTVDNLAQIFAVAAMAGLWLAMWWRLVHNLVTAADPWIGPLIGVGTLAVLVAAVAESPFTLLGAAVLLFTAWLPYMVVESAGQAFRVWGYRSPSPQARLLSLAAQAVVDAAALGGIAVLLVTLGGEGRIGVRLGAALTLAAPSLLARAVHRSRTQPVAATVGRQVSVCREPTATGRQHRPRR
ncbi:hypothetical protein GA0074695_4226 [Micromonospora viridifaciens]|uniref:Uncharacterized protein n=1 Tax=Micromonospora viridifaciens TaxID=1881 RepID=A0A1C4YGN1_MICVI|nr:hypothetical protein [Micromonospora viridifaciens]SCF19501.1 hypothetical protein GA0074695_4226 [Micromonospora viridifaciens]